jgi:hypothetical protein
MMLNQDLQVGYFACTLCKWSNIILLRAYTRYLSYYCQQAYCCHFYIIHVAAALVFALLLLV